MLGPKTRIGLALSFIPFLLSAHAPRLESQWVCSINWGMECDSDHNCQPPAPEDPPTFFNVDLDANVINLLAPPSRRGETTAIRVMERQDGQVMLAGIEGDRAWSMIIVESNGRMSLTITDDGAGWVVFGNCMAEDADAP